MSVGRLLDEMDSQELSDWQEFYRVDAAVRREASERARVDREIMGA